MSKIQTAANLAPSPVSEIIMPSLSALKINGIELAEFIFSDENTILQTVDLGAADLHLVRDLLGELHVAILTSSGDAIDLPVAQLSLLR